MKSMSILYVTDAQKAMINYRKMLHKFVEQLAAERNLDWEQLDLAALEEIWEEVKGGGTAV